MNLEKAYKWYKSNSKKSKQNRYRQLEKVIEEIKDEFNFKKIVGIETGASQDKNDGAVGLFFAKLCELTDGEFHSVDNNKDVHNQSKIMYDKFGLKVEHYLQDSIEFLKNTKVIPNLIHLDSWDLNLLNPFPSALHGWREFIAIEDKMPIGSVIIIDDNFFKGTWVKWVLEYTSTKSMDDQPFQKIDITYPIIGKGSMVYHFVEEGKSNWKKLSKDIVGSNQKITYIKIK
jgi:hypothetical protein|tara:strand:- start:1 stop:690 length:690 start_codon:yes stop_codon:yes gene_type:complete